MTAPTVANPRILDWEGCFNVRDLGGLATADGRRIRWGALVRSDIPTRLTAAGRRALVEHGVRTIVDVRFTDEVVVDDHLYPFRDAGAGLTPRYVNVPFHDWGPAGPDEERVSRYQAAQTRAELIRLDLDLNRAGIAAAVGVIADASDGGVLIHCHAGKDRTGIIVAVVLSLLGVSDQDIADDYALTQLNIEPLVEDWLDSQSNDPAERERLFNLAWPSAESMLNGLAYLRERHGSAAGYLYGAGITDDQLARLRDRLLEPA